MPWPFCCCSQGYTILVARLDGSNRPYKPSEVDMVPLQVLRVIDSLQLTAKYSVATPVNWQNGDKVMVTPNLSDDQANQKVSRHSHDINATVSLHLRRANGRTAVQRGGFACCLLHCASAPTTVNSLSAEEAACLQFSKGFEKKDVPSGKGYIRLTPQPNVA